MKKYYQEVIQKNITDLRNALLTAISYYFEQDENLDKDIRLRNEKLTDIDLVFNDREHLVLRETKLTFETNESDGLTYEKTMTLKSLSIEWLIAIYKNLSHNNITT